MEQSITIMRHETHTYEKQDIVILRSSPPADITALVIVSARIQDANKVLTIAAKRRIRKGQKQDSYARLAIRTKQGAILLLPGRYSIEVIQTVVWHFRAVVRLEYRYNLRLVDQETAPPENELAFDYDGNMVESWDAAQWFYEAARR